MHWYWQDQAMDCYTSFFGNWYQSYCPLFTPKFCFHSVSWEPIGWISPKYVPVLCPFIYAKISFPLNILKTTRHIYIYGLILTRSGLGLLHIIFFGNWYQSCGPLFIQKFRFCSISWEQIGRISTKFYICIHLGRIYLGIVTHHFSHICTRVMALDLRGNFFSAQYLQN